MGRADILSYFFNAWLKRTSELLDLASSSCIFAFWCASNSRIFEVLHSRGKLPTTWDQNLDGRVGGIILTGWQRYMHHAPLCELLAISIPSLVTDLVYLDDVERSGDDLWKQVQSLLKCPKHLKPTIAPTVIDSFTYIPHKDAYLKSCDFEGKEVFKLIMDDLHLLEWKVNRFRFKNEMKNELMDEIKSLAKKVIFSILAIIYFVKGSTHDNFHVKNFECSGV
ncbi:hypothetical protein Y032_0009g821 [Ancylostoma ceylanicum]|nr:hypothetical protein Y032_0009g821 [Ancylostoma ceylanicum]